MISFGKILKFHFYDTAMLARMKNDLSLSAPLPFWQYCAKYYREHAKREPYVEEIKLLDRLSQALQDDPKLIAVCELYTNDEMVANTYRDMMQKRKVLLHDKSAPVLTGSLLQLADSYLTRAGKKLPHPYAFALGENDTGTVVAYDPDDKSDDVFVLLLPDPAQDKDLDGFLASQASAKHLKKPQKIGCGGILTALLQENAAFQIELDALCQEEDPFFSHTLTQRFFGDFLIRIPHSAEEAVLAAAKEYGFCPKTVARAKDGCKMSLMLRQKELFSLDTSFLKSLFAQRKLSARLKNERKGDTAQISVSSVKVSLEGFSCTKASCAPTSAFFTNALYTALDAVILQALRGTAYWEQRLLISLRVPKKTDDKTASDLLSAIIGLYRLQAELGIPTSSHVVSDDSATAPVLSVIACGMSETDTKVSQNLSDAIGAIEIPKTAEGLPDFETLRKILRQIGQEKQEEPALSLHFMETIPEKKDEV